MSSERYSDSIDICMYQYILHNSAIFDVY